MVVVKNPEQYKFKGFRRSSNAKKKYDAILQHKKTGRLKHVSFGARGYEHYKDQTPLKLYSSKDHGDKQRRTRYRQRHTYAKPKYSSGWFALKYLW
jgi:hypothetical protein